MGITFVFSKLFEACIFIVVQLNLTKPNPKVKNKLELKYLFKVFLNLRYVLMLFKTDTSLYSIILTISLSQYKTLLQSRHGKKVEIRHRKNS